MKKRLISLLIVLTLVVGLFSGLSLTAFAVDFDGGSGTREDPYLISTAEQLKYFRDRVNSGYTTICAQLTGNIDLQNCAWDPIGLSSNGYRGTFDGCGYAIKNLQLDDYSNGTSAGGFILYGTGLFGVVGSSGTVKRVNVAGQVSINKTSSKALDIGLLCGGNLGTIEECFATVSFKNTNLSISYSNSSGHTNIGGLVGVNGGTIRNCYVVGDINANLNFTARNKNLNVGGLVGLTYQSGTTVENCYVAVPINVTSNSTNYHEGGIFGELTATGNFSNLYANVDYADCLVGNGYDSYLTDSWPLTPGYMRSTHFASVLGNAFVMDTENKNQGYPVLAVMAYDEEENKSNWVEDEINSSEESKEAFEALTPPELENRDLTRDITRAEFCAVSVELYEEMGGTVLNPAGLTSPFTDVSSDAVIKAYNLGLVNGVSATKFDPYTNISRQDMATLLTRVYKALALPGWKLEHDHLYTLDYSNVPLFEDDAYISAYAKPSVYFMVKNGVINGLTSTTFGPRNVTSAQQAIGYANATREQAILLAVRMFMKLDV